MNTAKLSTKEWREVCHEIEQQYGSTAVGVSVRGICPVCDGGSSKEVTFSVTREQGRLLFKCHRASCDFSGSTTYVRGNEVQEQSSTGSRKPSGRARYDQLTKGPLPQGVIGFLKTRYYLADRDFIAGDLRWTKDLSPNGFGRLVLPVKDFRGEIYGFVARKLDNQPGAKALSFLENSRGAWYKNISSRTLVIVEDQLSAIRASDRVNAVALLGTHLTQATIDSIREGKFGRVVVALDKDATTKSMHMAKNLRMEHDIQAGILMLRKDIKDMPYKDMVELFKSKDMI